LRLVRLVIARCQVDYVGRLTAHLPLATRLLLVKADGSVLVHSDGGSYKPLNWMSPPCSLTESEGFWRQILLAEQAEVLGAGWRVVRREYPTSIGPVDLLCKDADGGSVAVEIKRRGEIDGVSQLLRYLELMNRDPLLAPVTGVFAAQEIKPQARTFAEDKGIRCVVLDYDALRGVDDVDSRLF
jgi:RecB family endonuclease NucS